LIFLQ